MEKTEKPPYTGFIVKLGIGIAVFVALVLLVGAEKIASAFSGFDAIYMAPVLFLFLIGVLISALNMKILLDAKASIPLTGFMTKYLLSWAIGSLAPGKIGDFSIAYFTRKSLGIAQATAVVFLDKFITVFVVLAFGTYALVAYAQIGDAANIAMLFSAVMLACIFSVAWGPSRLLVGKLVPEFARKSFIHFSETLEWFFRYEKKRIATNLALTVLKLFVQAASFVLLFRGLGVEADVFVTAAITAAATITSFLPFTLSGLGVKEGVFALLFLNNGVPLEKSITLSIISGVLSYALVAIFSFLGRLKGGTQK